VSGEPSPISFAGYGPKSRASRPYVEAASIVIDRVGRDPVWCAWWASREDDRPLLILTFFDGRRRTSVKRHPDCVELTIERPVASLPTDREACLAMAQADVDDGLRRVAVAFGLELPASIVKAWADAGSTSADTESDADAGEVEAEVELRLPLDALSSRAADRLLERLWDLLDDIAECDDFEEMGDEWVLPISGDPERILAVLRPKARAGLALARARLVVPGATDRDEPVSIPLRS
jgi:hypothetical protein